MPFPAYFLLGNPLGHSLSPALHRKLFALHGDGANYRLLPTPPERLPETVRSLRAQSAGFNVTIPYKEKILPLLDRVHGPAAQWGAVNTVAVRGGELHGYNTDGEGFLFALRQASVPLRGRVLLLGNGGAARVLAATAVQAGAQVTVRVRPGSLARGQAMAQALAPLAAPGASLTVTDADPEGPFDLLCNATPVGMFPHPEEMPVAPALLARCAAVFDAVYNPHPTRLLQAAAANGAAVCDGLAMLVAQAAAAQRLWCGYAFTDTQLTQICREMAAEVPV